MGDLVVYTADTDPNADSFTTLVDWLDEMKRQSGGSCDYTVVQAKSYDYAAFVYITACPTQWLEMVSRDDFKSSVTEAYDWVVKKSDEIAKSAGLAKRSPENNETIEGIDRSMSLSSLQSRDLQQLWMSQWEFGQIAASGPTWLEHEELYKVVDGKGQYNYMHDDYNGAGQVIYVVDYPIDAVMPSVSSGTERTFTMLNALGIRCEQDGSGCLRLHVRAFTMDGQHAWLPGQCFGGWQDLRHSKSSYASHLQGPASGRESHLPS